MDKFIQINKSYTQSQLQCVNVDPFVQFAQWFADAQQAIPNELVNAMTVATVSDDGHPSARVVLLKRFDAQGFVFFTNYESKKGQQIQHNSQVALLFWWDKLARQIRIEGVAERVAPELSDEYFHSRHRLAQIAATVSAQSSVVNDVAQLQAEFNQLQQHYGDENEVIPRPDFWGGYCVKPELFEFWQGGEHRLHDRFQYRLNTKQQWQIARLAP